MGGGRRRLDPTPEWQALAERIAPRARESFLALETPIVLGGLAVGAIRERAPILAATGRDAGVGLLFAAARVLKLGGVSRDEFAFLSGLLFDLAAEDDEVAVHRKRRAEAEAQRQRTDTLAGLADDVRKRACDRCGGAVEGQRAAAADGTRRCPACVGKPWPVDDAAPVAPEVVHPDEPAPGG